MLEPSENFTAQEINYLQDEAGKWIESLNSKIIDAAMEMQKSASLNVHNPEETKVFNQYYNAPNAFKKHFESRGFKFEWSQSLITVSW